MNKLGLTLGIIAAVAVVTTAAYATKTIFCEDYGWAEVDDLSHI